MPYAGAPPKRVRTSKARTPREIVQHMTDAEAKDYLLELVEAFGPLVTNEMHPVDEWARHLPKKQRRLAIALYDSEWGLSREVLCQALYFDDLNRECNEDQALSSAVKHLRRRLPKHLKIKNLHGYGYQMVGQRAL